MPRSSLQRYDIFTVDLPLCTVVNIFAGWGLQRYNGWGTPTGVFPHSVATVDKINPTSSNR